MSEPENKHDIDEIKQKLVDKDMGTWHKILLGFAIVMAGLLLIGGIAMQNALKNAKEAAIQTPLVSLSAENRVLPDGKYRIHNIFLDDAQILHLMVSPKDGGVVVCVSPPEYTSITYPKDLLQKDITNFTLNVENGKWIFIGVTKKG